MTILILRENSLGGSVQARLCSLHNLHVLDLPNNNIFGSIPACLGGVAFRSKEWSPSNNGPPELTPSQRFDWTIARLFGLLIKVSLHPPEELQKELFVNKGSHQWYEQGSLIHVSAIDLLANKLTGGIPSALGNLTDLISLNLSYNSLAGVIPATLDNLHQIESLALSHYRLNGVIPSQFVGFSSMGAFSVACNNLSGCMDDIGGHMGSFDHASFEGNVDLRGSVPNRTCSVIPQASDGDSPSATDNVDEVVLFGLLAAGFTVGFWAAVFGLARTGQGKKFGRWVDGFSYWLLERPFAAGRWAPIDA